MSATVGGSGRADLSMRTTGAFDLFALVSLLVAIGLTALAIATDDNAVTRTDVLGGLGLVVGFAVARRVAIEVDLRHDSIRVTLTEIPLAVGIFLLDPSVVIAAFAVVVLIAGLARRDSPAKLAVNLAVSAISASLAVLTIQIFERLAPSIPNWVNILAGVSLGHGIGTALILIAVLLLPGAPDLGAAIKLNLRIYTVGVLNAVTGVAAVTVVQQISWGWLQIALSSVVLALLYWNYYGLLRESRDLGLLNKISLRVAGAGRSTEGNPGTDPDTLEPTIGLDLLAAMELSRQQLNATRVVLHRRIERNRYETVICGARLPGPLAGEDIEDLLGDPRVQDVQGAQHYVKEDFPARHARRLLHVRDATEILLAPLRGADRLLGLLEVHDRQNRLRRFGEADRRLVETLASHLATAMDNRRLLARLRHDAYHDPLTDLRNRLGFREAAATALQGPEPCAVVVIDLDLLGSVNDALGHAWGDRIVIAAGDRLREVLPPNLLCARLEGDTFAMFLKGADLPAALRFAETVRATLDAPYPVGELEVECSSAVGIALTDPDHVREVDVLLQHADVALTAARSGDDPVRSYVPSMGQVFMRRFQLVTHLRHALENGEVAVHYQPKLSLPDRHVIGVEALVRWHHSEFGLLDPEEFVTVVEATGLIDLLTEFVLERALEQCVAWRAQGLHLSVAVNLSVRNLVDEGFPARVADALARHRLEPGLLAFELTESAVMSDPERALPVLQTLHGMGVRIAVDDFGTGYSSLAYLRRLPVDEVKIDKSFVIGMASDLSDLAVVRAIVDLGHSLGLTVVAEGVEEDAARDQLVEMGCDVAQGYLISRPLSADRFDAWLQARTVRGRNIRDETVLTLLR